MARIPLYDLSNASEGEQAVYERFPANLVLGLLRTTTEIAAGYLQLGGAFRGSPLPPKLREMVILRVGALCDSAYERMQHIELAKSAGVDDAAIVAIESGGLDALNEVERSVLRFVDELVATPRATTSFSGALTALGEQGLATVTLMVGHYMMTARFVETLDIDLDAYPTTWEGT